jgi:stearoyl-CoA desaturase (delta-9 desaturase)
MLQGLLDLSTVGYIVAALVLTHITIASVTIFLHRHQAHRALDLSSASSHFFRFWLWLTTGTVTKEWAAIHRKHHAKVETSEDPHSPRVVGLNRVLWGGWVLYRNEAGNRDTIERYGHGTPDDWLEHHVYSAHPVYGLLLMLTIDLLLFGVVAGPLIWGVQMLWIPFWAAGVINGVGHYWGYRNYEIPDASTNIVPWGILIGGEELHNNHHTFASSAKLSVKWWEFDIGWMYIRILEALGQARVKKVAPAPIIEPGKVTVDLDTLRGVFTNRFQVITSYGREVMLPVLQEEIGKADETYQELLRRARRWMLRDDFLVAEPQREELESTLSLNERLATVYQFRQRLQALWKRSSMTQEALLKALQDWCSQAEASGIRSLQEFAHRLRSYSLPVAA